MKKVSEILKVTATVVGYLAITSVPEECGKSAYKSIKRDIKTLKALKADKKENTAEMEITAE